MRDIDSEANHMDWSYIVREIYQPNHGGRPQSASISVTLSYYGPRRDVFRYSSNTDYHYSVTVTGMELVASRFSGTMR